MVVDTSIFIEHLRSANKASTKLFLLADQQDPLYISMISVFELYSGAISDEQKLRVEKVLENVVILTFTQAAAIKAAEIYLQLKKKSKLIEFRDIFIAATCIVNNLPIATLNKKHFERIEGLHIA